MGLKPKDLCLIPHRVMLAAQADGWWVRSDIIWAKPNPMPESCRDRPTDAYEHIIMLTKSAKYYFDQDAVREPYLAVSLKRIESGLHHKHPSDIGVGIPPVNTERMGERFCHHGGRNIRNVWTFATSRTAVISQRSPKNFHGGASKRPARRETWCLIPSAAAVQPDGWQSNWGERRCFWTLPTAAEPTTR